MEIIHVVEFQLLKFKMHPVDEPMKTLLSNNNVAVCRICSGAKEFKAKKKPAGSL
jgi:hypothetical protein